MTSSTALAMSMPTQRRPKFATHAVAHPQNGSSTSPSLDDALMMRPEGFLRRVSDAPFPTHCLECVKFVEYIAGCGYLWLR